MLRIKKTQLLSIVLIIFMVTCLGIINYFFRFPWKTDYVFLKFDAYIANETNTNYILNLPYLVNRIYDKELTTDNIQYIKFKDSSITETIDFNIVPGNNIKNYVTKTLSLNTHFSKPGIEDITDIEIHLKDGQTLIYPIGNWKFEVLNAANNKTHLELNSQIPLSKYLSNYELDYTNISPNDVYITGIKVDIPNINIEFKPFLIPTNTTICERVYISPKTPSSHLDLYLVKPLIFYKYQQQEYVFFPSSTCYGVFEMDKKSISKILSEDID